MDEERQNKQLEPIYNSSVPIQDVTLKTYQERWTIETIGKRGSGKSVLAAQHDDDDDVIEYSLLGVLYFLNSPFIHVSLIEIH